jgi:hypothetical protein
MVAKNRKEKEKEIEKCRKEDRTPIKGDSCFISFDINGQKTTKAVWGMQVEGRL